MGATPSDRPELTVGQLERWEAGGAMWRALEVAGDRAVVELCTCYGEPVDVLAGESPDLVRYVRQHAADG